MAQALIRISEVKARTGLSRSEIYRREKLGKFPRRVRLGARSVAWVAEEIEGFISQRIKASRQTAGGAA